MSRQSSRNDTPMLNLEGLSDEGLQELRDSIDAEQRKRATQAKAVARKQIMEIAKANAIDLAELGSRGGTYRYRNPDNQFEVWTGRGRQPKWFKDQIALGKSLDDLKIA